MRGPYFKGYIGTRQGREVPLCYERGPGGSRQARVGEEEVTMAESTGGEIAEVLRVMRGMQETVQGLSSRMSELTLTQLGQNAFIRGLETRLDGQSAQLSALATRMDGMTSRMEEQSAQLSALATKVDDKAELLEGLGAKYLDSHSALEARVQRTEAHCEELDKRVQVLESR